MDQLSNEVRQKLAEVRPETLVRKTTTQREKHSGLILIIGCCKENRRHDTSSYGCFNEICKAYI